MRDEDRTKKQLADELETLHIEIAKLRKIEAEHRQMEKALNQAQAELEKKVEERTTDLKSANKKLHQQIIERHRTEEALRDSENRFRAQYKNMPIPTYTWQRVGQDFILIDYNSAGFAITEGNVDNLLGIKASEAYPDMPEIPQNMERCFTEKTTISEEIFYRFRSLKKSGYFATTYAFVPPDLVLLHMEDINKRKRIEDALRSNAEILKAVCAISEQFLRSASWEEKNIQEVVDRLGQATGVSCISIFKNTVGVDGIPLTSRHYEWISRGLCFKKNKMELQVFSWRHDVLKSWKKMLSKGQVIHGHTRVFPGLQKEFLTKQDIKSIVIVPIFVGKKWWGFISFEEFLNEREWTSMEIDTLKTAGDILGALIYRKQVMNERKDSETKFRNLSEEISDGVAVIIDQKIHWANKAFLDIFGYRMETLIGKTMDFLIVPEEVSKINQLIEGVLSGQSVTFHSEIIGKREDEKWIIIDCAVKRITFENKPGIQLLIRDITEHKQVEQALRESEERFRIIVQNSPFPISIFDSSGKYLYINRKFKEVFGYSLGDITSGRRWFELAFPEPKYRYEAISLWKSDLERMKIGRITPRLFSVRCKDGSVREIIFRPLPMSDDKVFILYEDITDRKRAQEEIYRAKEYLEKVFDSVMDAIIVTDLKMRTLSCNHITEKIFGYKKDEIIGKSIRKFFPDTPLFKDLIRNAFIKIKQLGHFEGEIILRHKNGSTFPVSLIASMLIGTDGKPIGIVGVARDITERKQAEEAKERLEAHLHQAQKMEAIGTLAGGIAHDFNNILTMILGYSEMILHPGLEDNLIQSHVEELIKACNRGKDLVKQILTFSRKVEEERKPVQIHLIVIEALSLIRASLPKTIEIRQEIDMESGVVMASATQIYQIMMNLCSNASYAMREGGGILDVKLGVVEIDSGFEGIPHDLKDGTYVRLTVSDTGHGIEKANLERIFDPFFTTKSPGEGTGMGLSTVHGIVKAHEGAIVVNSEPGKGATFHIYFPRLSSAVEIGKITPEPIPEGQERILFIDDEESIIIAGKIVLERLGYKVTALQNGVEALEAFRKMPEDFDLVITDQTMPLMTGAELAKKLMMIRPDIPVILTTGYSEIITQEKAKELGIRDYIMKPFLARDLAKVIRRVMDQKYTL